MNCCKKYFFDCLPNLQKFALALCKISNFFHFPRYYIQIYYCQLWGWLPTAILISILYSFFMCSTQVYTEEELTNIYTKSISTQNIRNGRCKTITTAATQQKMWNNKIVKKKRIMMPKKQEEDQETCGKTVSSLI